MSDSDGTEREDSVLRYPQGTFVIRVCPAMMDIGDNVRMLHDRSRISFQPIDDLDPLLVTWTLQRLVDQILESGLVRKLPEKLNVRTVIHCGEKAVDDSLGLRFGVVEMGSHGHHHRLPSVQPLIQFRVRGFDGVCVQNDRAVDTKVFRHDQGKVKLENAGTDDVGCTGIGLSYR